MRPSWHLTCYLSFRALGQVLVPGGEYSRLYAVLARLRALECLEILQGTYMKKALVTLLLMLCAAAHAEWTQVGISTDGETKIYVDKSTIKRNGVIVKYWALYDYAKPQLDQSYPYSSYRVFEEVNCSENEKRTNYFTASDRRMGDGNPTYTNNSKHPWDPLVPGSLGQIIAYYVCKSESK